MAELFYETFKTKHEKRYIVWAVKKFQIYRNKFEYLLISKLMCFSFMVMGAGYIQIHGVVLDY